MPSVAEDQQHSLFHPHSPRKRRRDLDPTELKLSAAHQTPFHSNVSPTQGIANTSNSIAAESGTSATRKPIVYPSAKRPRIVQDAAPSADSTSTPARQLARPCAPRAQTAPVLPRSDVGGDGVVRSQLQSPPRHNTPAQSMAAILAPCHICHRRPTKRSDLDSFAQCEGCGERACYICIRECQGWSAQQLEALGGPTQPARDQSFTMTDVGQEEFGHGRLSASDLDEDEDETIRDGWPVGKHCTVVCSRCCIERGVDGDAVCMGCVSGEQAQ